MYLKSLEVHGFKSFANKIVFDFHNGITGIVGPNGSGKSNVADAVRWVLGEQSTKQLRGSSMQDVIFAGTENRKPLSYAYVAITLDNSDHELAIDFEEVTIARRLYRSGESEYLINGNVSRLKQVSELFYDTGIGKEGYSIIGQGQIDRILSGKPEEKRELFDEAAGIVKFKKRKVSAWKRLENERENLVRINDILAELERQVEPLQKQSEKAKVYLKKKSELKEFDVNLFLMETERMEQEKNELAQKCRIASFDMQETQAAYEKTKAEYEQMQVSIKEMDETIHTIREQINQSAIGREKMENQIHLLHEQIHTIEMTDEHLKSRLSSVEKEKKERLAEKKSYEEKKASLDGQFAAMKEKKEKAAAELETVQAGIAACNAEMEQEQKELIQLLNNNAAIKARQQKYDTMLEQINIRKAELSKRLLARKTEEEGLLLELKQYDAAFTRVNEKLEALHRQERKLLEEVIGWKQEENENNRRIEESQLMYHKSHSRLESLKNIAERYDGYGNSIRRVMEQKHANPGLIGVVSDLIQVEKRYETAIETALGGSIQNIVTEDEKTAKKMIEYLKKNRFGRATFLPLTGVSAKSNPRTESAMHEPGVIGVANQLVTCEEKYRGIAAYLLGRVLVVDTIDHAISIAKKFHHSLHMVTLEGESLSPGGSMTGGAFRNSSNLLARNREIEELEEEVETLKHNLGVMRDRKEDIATALVLNEDELAAVREEIQEQVILQNSAKMNLERAAQKQKESENEFSGLMEESRQLETQILEIRKEKHGTIEEAGEAKERRAEIEENSRKFQLILEEQTKQEEAAKKAFSDIAMEEAATEQNIAFTKENINRIDHEIYKFDLESGYLTENMAQAKEDISRKHGEIAQIQAAIQTAEEEQGNLQEQLSVNLEKKEAMSRKYSGFFRKQEEISMRKNDLDKELFRLNSQLEKLKEAEAFQVNYMWEEYEITPHEAKGFRRENYGSLSELKKQIMQIKEEIRKLGSVNVNAIEEYKEIAERYEFLKAQHDDLTQAEQTLIGIIEELDSGMRKQFEEKFAEIQKEFDSSFQLLFGGGHGTLELVEDEDILECGIRIIAQPPGKKLQNMMQLSGGEKALTAIALLFAIQSLKPSPFCLLDEIEAALDDSNVTRFANYLNRLTKDTQFIVITHRRGTMTAADRLYGITMQEKGVSTLVSVNLVENELDA
uniref:chromosome segregation protein SMC n=1 Tax=Agathobacter sp. TaxID=2021311 RepID=UPI004056F197